MKTRVLGATILAVAAYFVQCGGDETNNTDLPPVVYGGSASDEAFERVWPKIATAESSVSSSAKITGPANGTAVPAASAQKISWMIGLARREATGGGRAFASESALYFGSALAEAHLPPVTGDVFMLEFRTSANEAEPLRVFTTDSEWFPDPVSWDRLKAAGAPISLKIYNAYVNKNVVEEGPFTRDETVTFTITP